MNIQELYSFRLEDTVKFHDRLNPRLWDERENLHPQVREKLLEIAADFQEFLGIPDLDVKDITISGSNAAYNYTPSSDIDLHLLVDLPQADTSDVFRELFDAKKYQYNDEHNITIGGHDVELYVQDPSKPHYSQGIYSVLNNKWITVPRRRRPEINDVSVTSKVEDLSARIDAALNSGSYDRIKDLIAKIKHMRQTGLEQQGEFGSDNLAYKVLRNQGLIQKLYKARTAARDQELSLNERRKKKRRQRVRYGFGGWFYPGYSFDSGADSGGGDGGGGESVNEDHSATKNIVKKFIAQSAKRLGITRMPRIKLYTDPEWSEKEHSFGRYTPETHTLEVNLANRHIMDILRTTAHELVHCRQNQQRALPDSAGETGSPWENEAHAIAGVIMRDFADSHPELFGEHTLEEGLLARTAAGAALAAAMAMTPAKAQEYLPQDQQPQVQQQQGLSVMQILRIAQTLARLKNNPPTAAGAQEELEQELKNYLRAQRGDPNAQNLSRMWQWQQRQQQQQQQQQPPGQVNEASGYIPTQAERNDPRFSMALTKDVKPGETGRQANKMSLKTDSQGRPALLMKTVNLVKENRRPNKSQGDGRVRDLNQPLGPETPPTMPKGTVRVDVSDVYDWYKLGQHISNLKGLGRHDFGKGPPSSIVSFGDEETEHRFIKDLAATGLDVTDIDPRDPVQPPGKKIKTDPTYNVDEDELVESLRQEFELLEDQYLSEVSMSPTNLRRLAAEIDARAGMEFEMIVPGTDEEREPTPDESMDEPVRSLSQVEEFFNDGNYNSRRDVRRLMDQLRDDFYDSEAVGDFERKEWANAADRFTKQWIEDKYGDDLYNEAMEEVRSETPEFGVNGDEFREAVAQRWRQKIADRAEDLLANMGADFDDLYDSWRDEEWSEIFGDDDEIFGIWAESEGLYSMQDIASRYSINFPHWLDQDGSGLDMANIAKEFSDMIGRPANYSSQYHGAAREPDAYAIEPDSSLQADDNESTGLEFVSPPLPLDELLKDLNKIKQWAGMQGAYTNESTGLHINVSVPGYSLAKIDFVKLALLMGDEYVLEQFGRAANTYTESAMKIIRSKLRGDPSRAAEMLEKMRGHMDALAAKVIHTGVTKKYTSINTKDGYIEFRSPGGDWLDENFDKVENTLLRFVVATDAAMDPDKYRKEYQKKLYKLLTTDSDAREETSVSRILSMYLSGETDEKTAARQLAKEKITQRRSQQALKTGQGGRFWWAVTRPGSAAGIEVVAATEQEAKERASQEYPGWYPQDLRARVLRPYEAPAQSPQPQAAARPNVGTQTDMENRLGLGSQSADANYEIVDRRTNRPVFLFVAMTDQVAQRKYTDWLAAAGYPEDTEDFGWRRRDAAGPAAVTSRDQPQPQTFTGRWKLLIGGEHVFTVDGETQGIANAAARQWLSQRSPEFNQEYQGREVEVVPIYA